MTVIETKERIEQALITAKEAFGEAKDRVDYSVDVEVNSIEGAEDDITCVIGTLSIGPANATEDDKLYLPLDAWVSEDATVNGEAFEENLETFTARVDAIRERVLASDDYDAEISAVIADFDREIEEKYQAELEKLNKIAKRNLIIAAVATAATAVFAAVIILLQRLA